MEDLTMNVFKKSGVMVDCSRNAVMKVSSVKMLIDKLKLVGYNFLMLYTEDTYEIPDEPLFGYLRGRYSQEELKEIDEYAAQNGIEVIPCIQTLGHLNQLFVWDKYSAIRDIEDILLAGEEKTYALIEKMFASISQCLKTKTIHIGMDEAHALGLGKYLDKNGYRSRTEILFEHLIKVCEIAKRFGYTVIMWADMFYRCVNNGEYYAPKGLSHLPQSLVERLPDNLEITYWDYYHDKEEQYATYIQGHQELNKEVWFAGGLWKWVGYCPVNKLSINRTKEAVAACVKNKVEKVVFTVWGDDGSECVFDAVLPSLFYAAECCKGNSDLQEIKQKFETLFEQNWDDMLLCDMTMSFSKKGSVQLSGCYNGVKPMLYSDCFCGKFDSTIRGDGSETKEFATLATKLLQAKERSKHYKLLFENYYRLAVIMSKKYDLSYRTRTAYQQGDKVALQSIVEDYDILLKEYSLFMENYEALWLKDNKANGLEVIQIRIGGVMQRLKSCKKRLEGYLANRIERIEELEEKIIPYKQTEEESKMPPFVIKYRDIATINVF